MKTKNGRKIDLVSIACFIAASVLLFIVLFFKIMTKNNMKEVPLPINEIVVDSYYNPVYHQYDVVHYAIVKTKDCTYKYKINKHQKVGDTIIIKH